MKLQDLFSKISVISSSQLPDVEVLGIYNDARQVQAQTIFVAIRGNTVDGHSFIPQAIQNGALCLVVESEDMIPASYVGARVVVANSRVALDKLAATFYGFPADQLFCVGVTGTNGKTSVSYLTEAVLNFGGKLTGVIGTVNHHVGSKIWDSNMTTPDPLFLQKRLKEFIDCGAKAVVLEVSSHALDQNRVDSIPFDVAVFTNLTRDHLDYHGTMEKYLEAKQKLTLEMLDRSSKNKKTAIINGDDEAGANLKVSASATKWLFGKSNGDFQYKITHMDFIWTHFTLQTPSGVQEFQLPMSGEHNVQNAVAAIAIGLAAGMSLSDCAQAIKEFSGVPGRLQSVANDKGIAVFVDYAHTPDALENVLKSIQNIKLNLNSSPQVITVFGCGGDRDKGKRPMMAAIAERYSTQVIVTSDNPRTENPEEIISEIIKGFHQTSSVEVIEDRAQAIRRAIQMAKAGDVVLIAGKGHEDYQIIGTTKYHFSDFEQAAAALGERS